MNEAALLPLISGGLLAVGGLLFYAGTLVSQVKALREWHESQREDTRKLAIATARLAEGHLEVVRMLNHMRGQLDMLIERPRPP